MLPRTGSSTGSLPWDVTAAARRRLAIAASVVAAVWFLYLILFWLVWNERAIWESRVIAMVSIGVSVLLAKYLLRCNRASRIMLLGAGYEVFVCLAVALSGYFALETWAMTPLVPWTCGLILFFPALMPASPRVVLIDSLIAATAEPVAYVVFLALGGTGTDDVSVLVSLWLPPYLCALLAVVPAKVMYGLGTDVKKARRMGAYQLVEELGRGGMGEVWRAKHRMLVRPAAIKMIRPDAANAERLRQRFEREAQATASLESPHTVQLYDFGVTDDGAFYYVMELLRGIDLETMVKKFGPLPPSRVVRLLVQACDSLDDAHRAGLVHRDIKPANLYASRLGRRLDFVKVLDFGLVTAGRDMGAKEDLATTAAGAILGTPAFMAPEMTTGDHEVDGRADIYSLACVGVWLLTSKFVFDADTPMAMAVAHATQQPSPPSSRCASEIPAALDALLLETLAKDPSDRPQTALEFADRLEAASASLEPWSADLAQQWWDAHLPDVMAGGHSTHGSSESAAAFMNPAQP